MLKPLHLEMILKKHLLGNTILKYVPILFCNKVYTLTKLPSHNLHFKLVFLYV